MAVLRDEDGAVRLAHAPDVCGEVVAALRERNDILGRTATADGRANVSVLVAIYFNLILKFPI